LRCFGESLLGKEAPRRSRGKPRSLQAVSKTNRPGCGIDCLVGRLLNVATLRQHPLLDLRTRDVNPIATLKLHL
jgi:hypothetical protein